MISSEEMLDVFVDCILQNKLVSEFANNNEDEIGDFDISSNTKKNWLIKMSLNGVFHTGLVMGPQ